MNSTGVTPQTHLTPTSLPCGAELVGERVWNLLLAIEQFSENWVIHGVPKIHSYGRLPDEEEIRAWPVPRSTGCWLHTLMRVTEAKTVLEIGTSFGYSTLWMASGLAPNQGHIYTCELFEPKMEIANRNFAQSGLHNISLLSGDAMRTAKIWDKRIDILFLDADPANYRSYWSSLKPWLHADSLLIMDNAIDHLTITEPFIQEIANEEGWQSWVAPFDHGLLFAKPN